MLFLFLYFHDGILLILISASCLRIEKPTNDKPPYKTGLFSSEAVSRRCDLGRIWEI